jgi:hypothetical protein
MINALLPFRPLDDPVQHITLHWPGIFETIAAISSLNGICMTIRILGRHPQSSRTLVDNPASISSQSFSL